MPFFNLPNLVQETPCHPPIGFPKLNPPSCWDEAGHPMKAERAVYKGLDPRGSWRLKAIGVCLRLAEVTLKTAENCDVQTLGALPRRQEPHSSPFKSVT